MQQKYLLKFIFLFSFFGIVAIISCNSNDESVYEPVSPVVMDLTQVPYPKLSDYKFFEGELKNLTPAYRVIPFEPASQLFTDYAHKKRFVWMPTGVKASYNGDNKVLKFPTGTALIKSFFYENVQPGNTTRIIETRIMIKKGVDAQQNDIWIFANYVWNDQQTEAYLDLNGSYFPISWKDENNTIKSSNYRIPSATECLTCHKSNEKPIPIGPKPQNLNFSYSYSNGAKNQLSQWVNVGYLDGNYPSNISSTINWKDTDQPLELRVRSYIDANCAHCHSTNSHCDYRPMRFAFSETSNPVNLGVCVAPQENIDNSLTYIVTKGNAQRSVMHFRLSSVNEATRMPLLGRTIVHEEAVQMIEQWINSLNPACN